MGLFYLSIYFKKKFDFIKKSKKGSYSLLKCKGS